MGNGERVQVREAVDDNGSTIHVCERAPSPLVSIGTYQTGDGYPPIDSFQASVSSISAGTTLFSGWSHITGSFGHSAFDGSGVISFAQNIYRIDIQAQADGAVGALVDITVSPATGGGTFSGANLRFGRNTFHCYTPVSFQNFVFNHSIWAFSSTGTKDTAISISAIHRAGGSMNIDLDVILTPLGI